MERDGVEWSDMENNNMPLRMVQKMKMDESKKIKRNDL